MDKKKVQDLCEGLRDLIDLGPGHNPDILRKTLAIVRTLRAAVQSDYARQILDDLKDRLGRWFSDRTWRGDEAQLRSDLMQDLAALRASWEGPDGKG